MVRHGINFAAAFGVSVVLMYFWMSAMTSAAFHVHALGTTVGVPWICLIFATLFGMLFISRK